ncbi:MAG TPA: HisA/HisF-related TIM barrel protein [Methylocella sp.]|nr:HisA/HisF-related TIM barrel protein [Methylocella sp.]
MINKGPSNDRGSEEMPQRAVEVIPVIDLKRGKAVRARQGLRHSYEPAVSAISRTSAPLDAVSGYLSVWPFLAFYIADLDAIEGLGSHETVIREMCSAFPDVSFWIDAGVSGKESALSWLARHRHAHLVIGTETLEDGACLEELSRNSRIILSLDYRGSEFLGPASVCRCPQFWPQRVIVMTLSRVGCGGGPDMERLAQIRRLAPHARLYAAGGLRGASDLMQLREAGISGALVASALHDGRLTRADLSRIMPPGEMSAK